MRIARAVASALALAGLTVGVPLALLAFGHLPSWADLADLPGEMLTDATAFALLTLLAWAAWATFTAIVVVELVVELSGSRRWRLPSGIPFQATARRLVAAATMSATLSGALLARAGTAPALAAPAVTAVLPAPGPSVPATVSRQPDGATNLERIVAPAAHPRPPVDAEVPPAADTLPTVTVVAGDTPWGIAEHHLGHGIRWREIWDLNRGTPQADGRAWVTEDLIHPGWRLRLPVDAVGVAPPPAPPAPAAGTAASAEANGSPPPGPPATATPVAPTPNGPEATPDTLAGAGADTPTDDRRDRGDGSLTEILPVLAGITGATVVATGLAFDIRRRRRRRAASSARSPRPPANRHDLDTEHAVAVASDLPLVCWVGHHLATLADHTSSHADAGPVAVEFSAETGIELLWDSPEPFAHSPWIAADGGWAWRLDYDPDEPVPPNDRPAGIPGLVTIGQRDGRQLLVDLEAFGSLALLGDAERAGDLARSIAFELGTSEELASAQVVLAGLDIAGTDALPRIRSESADRALARVRGTVADIDNALEQCSVESTFAYRTRGTWTDITIVMIPDDELHAAAFVDASPPRRAVATIVVGPGVETPAHIIIEADGSARLEPLGLRFHATGLPSDSAADVTALLDALDQPATDERPLGTSTHRTRDPSPNVARTNGTQEMPQVGRHTGDGLHRGEADHHVSGDTRYSGAPPQRTDAAYDDGEDEAVRISERHGPNRDDASDSEPPWPQLMVKVLGRPHVPERPSLTRRQLALVVYLASRGQPTPASNVQHAVWSGRAIQPKTIWNVATATRAALGTLDDGTPAMLPSQRAHNTLALAPGVRTDLHVLRDLYDRAQHAPATQAIELLRSGLDLIEGQPFDGPDYEWAHHTELLVAQATQLIEDATEHLVDLATDAGRTDLARHAITQGLRALPGNEVLYRARMTVEHDDGNVAAVHAAYEEVVSFLADIDAEPSQATIDLYRQLRPRPGSRAS